MSCDVLLTGGWGYGNLGDELILRRYTEFLRKEGRKVVVASHSPKLTRSQHPDLPFPVVSQGGRLPRCEVLLIGGGGYLNGAWRRQCTQRLAWLAWASQRADRVVAHAVEARNFKRHQLPLLRRSLGLAHVSVRDARSRATLSAAGVAADQVPDAIFLGDLPRSPLRSHAVLNVMDVPRRADSHEAGFGMEGWKESLAVIANSLGGEALIAANDQDEAEYAEALGLGLPIEVPRTPLDLEELLGGARACVATRMHYGLFPLRMGVPSVLLPYNGKVRGTLDTVGLPDRVVSPHGIEEIRALIEQGPQQSALDSARRRCDSWLMSALSSPPDRRTE